MRNGKTALEPRCGHADGAPSIVVFERALARPEVAGLGARAASRRSLTRVGRPADME